MPSPRPLSRATSKDIVSADSRRSGRTIRIFSWNINGIGPYLPSQSTKITSFFKPSDPNQQPLPQPKTHGLRAFLSRHGWPEVLFLQELKIQQGDTKTLAALLSSLNTPLHPDDDQLTDSRTYKLDAVLPRDKYNAGGFGGRLYGVGTVLRTDFARSHVALVRAADWDLEGRVSIVELSCSSSSCSSHVPSDGSPNTDDDNTSTTCTTTNGHIANDNTTIQHETPPTPPNHHVPLRLALINIYAVNGTSAPYRDLHTGGIIQVQARVTPTPTPTAAGRRAGLVHVRTRHDHKLAFHTRLRDECLALERRGFGVVVAGDANVARGPLDGFPGLRTFPRQHCVNRRDFNGRFFGAGDNWRAGARFLFQGGVGEVVVGREEEEEKGEGEERGEDEEDKKEEQEDKDNSDCLDAVDVFRAMHGHERRYTYYPRTKEWGTSCDRVDMVFVSRRLWEAGRVVATGILDTPQERGLSDHVPIWVEIALEDKSTQ